MTGLRAIVVGAAAGGGFPQWNCRGPVCARFWDGDPRVQARTQSSLAVSVSGEDWLLLNCSPDIRQQIIQTPALQPRQTPRHTPIGAVLVTNGDIDHIAGLLTLREKQRFTLYGTASVLKALKDNRVFDALDPKFVSRKAIELGATKELLPGLEVETFAVPGKVPLYLEEGEPDIGAEGENTIGVRVSSKRTGSTLYYIPGCAHVPDSLFKRLRGASLLLFDGTLWQDDEMIQSGAGKKTGRRMGHISMSGPEGSIAAFAKAEIAQKIFVHINNTNPTLIDDGPERRQAEEAGWEIAYDGMEISL
ncbi:MAG: pyrroloquinoline quinone biosynthesis protein PqqB [Pseudomonadota bacterium]